MGPGDEAQRLEALWTGDFGDAYVDRNQGAYDMRRPFWERILELTGARRVLEIGCNVGGNLRWLEPALEDGCTFGIDVNRKALSHVHADLPGINAIWCPARDLPFKAEFFDLVFTMGVLIHQPGETLPDVMAEMVRCSNRWILCGEYYALEDTEVPYRGVDGALFKRDYGRLFQEQFPMLQLVDEGFLSSDDGWDDVTWWLLRK